LFEKTAGEAAPLFMKIALTIKRAMFEPESVLKTKIALFASGALAIGR
jgi:hypothetical protein